MRLFPFHGRQRVFGAVQWRSALRPVLAMVSLLLVLDGVRRLPSVQHLLAMAPHWHETPHAMLWFLLLAIPYCTFGLPRQALCVAAGLAFGLVAGLGLSSVAYGLGALLGYAWARIWAPLRARQALRQALDRKYPVLVRILHRRPFTAVLMARLMPVGSALLVSLAAGLFELPVGAFALASVLGGLPQTLVFVLIGGGMTFGQTFQLVLAGVLFVVSGLLGATLLRFGAREARGAIKTGGIPLPDARRVGAGSVGTESIVTGSVGDRPAEAE